MAVGVTVGRAGVGVAALAVAVGVEVAALTAGVGVAALGVIGTQALNKIAGTIRTINPLPKALRKSINTSLRARIICHAKALLR